MSDERDVQEVMARYVRAVDQRDAATLAGLFMADGCVEVFELQGGTPIPIMKFEGSARIGKALSAMPKPHPPLGRSHHTTHDAIVSIHGDKATIDVGFIVYDTVGADRPAAGWSAGAQGPQGTVIASQAGYCRSNLKRLGHGWKIAALRITNDLPVAASSA